ncbi:MAG TPA: aryl-sulfate sulfotransferase [Bacteroidales bacterium]|nr:aryl-sulfate sulfotransferase [Bacteroidales bacterium]
MKKIICLFISVFAGLLLFSQSWGEYTLYSKTGDTKTYLLDLTGATYKTWTSTTSRKTGYSSYMIEGDTLVRTIQNSGTFGGGGGVTGGVQKVTWDGTVVWDFTYNSTTYCLHHDICPMPNGNVLMICYEYKTSTEAVAAGCSTSRNINSEKLIEVKPTGATTGEIVWEWHLWDHLCQTTSSTKPGYVTSIVQNPQLMNINYGTSGGAPGTLDWMHMNGIDYNEELDQITFSSHNLNEIYVIDHSTTTAEAASHSGGNSGKGGDFLYRWGNPAAYSATGTTIFDVVHDAHWISSDHPEYAGYLSAINNGGGTSGKAAIEFVDAPLNGSVYDITLGQAFQPTTYTDRFNTNYTSQGQGNSEQFPNGNMLLCVPSNTLTYIYEVNDAGTTIWTKNISGQVAQAHRYEKCFIRPVNAEVSASEQIVCPGDPVTITTLATAITETSPSYSYSWTSVPEGYSSVAENPLVYPQQATTYTVIVTNDQSGCTDEVSVFIAVNPAPEIPVISANDNTLTSSVADSYQWYLNGEAIEGANSQSITPEETGTYQVEVTTNSYECSSMSEEYYYDVLAIEDDLQSKISVYPNPNTGIFNIYSESDFSFEVINTGGEVIYSGNNSGNIDLSYLSNGVYFIVIHSDNISKTEKIIIIK